MGPGPKPAPPPPQPDAKINLTDPDSPSMKTPRGFLQGYNAQIVTTKHQIVIAAEITTSGSDFQQLEPMVSAAERELESAGAAERPATVLADAGYGANGHIDALRERGITRSSPPRPLPGGPEARAGRRPLRLHAAGTNNWDRRPALLTASVDVELVFGDIKTNRSARRLKRRGPAARRARRGVFSPPPTPC